MTIEFTDTLGRKRTGQVVTSNRYDIVVDADWVNKEIPQGIPNVMIIGRNTHRVHSLFIDEAMVYTYYVMGKKRYSRLLRFILAYVREYMEGLNEH